MQDFACMKKVKLGMMRILFSALMLGNILGINSASCDVLGSYRATVLDLHAYGSITSQEKKDLLGAIARQRRILTTCRYFTKLRDPQFVDIAPERIAVIAQMLPIDTLDYSSFKCADNRHAQMIQEVSNVAFARFSKKKCRVDLEKLKKSVLYQISCQRADQVDKILLEIRPQEEKKHIESETMSILEQYLNDQVKAHESDSKGFYSIFGGSSTTSSTASLSNSGNDSDTSSSR